MIVYNNISVVKVFDMASVGNASSIAYSASLTPIATCRGSGAAGESATNEMIMNAATERLELRCGDFPAIIL